MVLLAPPDRVELGLWGPFITYTGLVTVTWVSLLPSIVVDSVKISDRREKLNYFVSSYKTLRRPSTQFCHQFSQVFAKITVLSLLPCSSSHPPPLPHLSWLLTSHTGRISNQLQANKLQQFMDGMCQMFCVLCSCACVHRLIADWLFELCAFCLFTCYWRLTCYLT